MAAAAAPRHGEPEGRIVAPTRSQPAANNPTVVWIAQRVSEEPWPMGTSIANSNGARTMKVKADTKTRLAGLNNELLLTDDRALVIFMDLRPCIMR